MAERRTGQAAGLVLPFAAAALVVLAIAVGADAALLRRIGPGLYWAVVILFGSLVTARPSVESSTPHREMLALLGVDPIASYLANTVAAAAMIGVLQAILAPVALVLFDLPLRALASTVAVAVLGSLALAAIGTLAAELSRDQRIGASFIPLITTPLAVPLAIAAVQVAEAETYDGASLPWLLLVAAMAVVALASGVLVARFTGGSA